MPAKGDSTKADSVTGLLGWSKTLTTVGAVGAFILIFAYRSLVIEPNEREADRKSATDHARAAVEQLGKAAERQADATDRNTKMLFDMQSETHRNQKLLIDVQRKGKMP